jgi:hypothetical protein
MKGKIALVLGAAAGYVLGTRDGRERYEQMKAKATGMWQDPKVQRKVSEVSDLAKEKAPVVKDKLAEKVGASGDSGGDGAPTVGGSGFGTSGVGAGTGSTGASGIGTTLPGGDALPPETPSTRPTPGSVGG